MPCEHDQCRYLQPAQSGVDSMLGGKHLYLQKLGFAAEHLDPAKRQQICLL